MFPYGINGLEKINCFRDEVHAPNSRLYQIRPEENIDLLQEKSPDISRIGENMSKE